MKRKPAPATDDPCIERLAYTAPDQIEWIQKSEAHLAAEAELAAKQAAARDAGDAQPAHPAN